MKQGIRHHNKHGSQDIKIKEERRQWFDNMKV